MVVSRFEKSAAYWIHILRRATERVRSAYIPNTSTFYILLLLWLVKYLWLPPVCANPTVLQVRTKFFKPVVVVSISSPDCDGLPRTESEDRDRFDGGWLMLSEASGKLETH